MSDTHQVVPFLGLICLPYEYPTALIDLWISIKNLPGDIGVRVLMNILPNT